MPKFPSRFFVRANSIKEGKALIDDKDDIRKARNVLRLKIADEVIVIQEGQKAYQAKIENVTKDFLLASIEEEIELNSPPRFNLTLAQALPKASKMDQIIRMNTEVGVSRFVPFESDYSVIKAANLKENKIARWRKIAKEAASQSMRVSIPEVRDPIKFEEIFGIDADIKLTMHTSRSQKFSDLREIVGNLSLDQSILVCIGPEGGFSNEEIDMFIKNEFKVVTLDTPILRTETAGIVACGMLLG